MTSAINVWANFLKHDKLDPEYLLLKDIQTIIILCQRLSEKYPEPKPYRSYKDRLIHRRYVCETAIDMSIDIVSIKHKKNGKVIAGRGLLDMWAIVYKEKFGSAHGTNGWFETKRRDVSTKLSKSDEV